MFQFTGLIRGPTPWASISHRASAFQFTGLIRGPTSVSLTANIDSMFQFTGLIRGPTSGFNVGACYSDVSIHRPHTRPDVRVRRIGITHRCFNSQASYEARQDMDAVEFEKRMFQFTGLIRGPTYGVFSGYYPECVSIHRPHTRPD